MGFVEKFIADMVGSFTGAATLSGPALIARPAQLNDLTRPEHGMMSLYLQRTNNYAQEFMDVRRKFDNFLPYMLVVEKMGKIIGFGIMRADNPLEKSENCVTMLMTDLNENSFEIAQILIGGFARQALSQDQKTLNILSLPGDRFMKRVCESFSAIKTYVPASPKTDYQPMVKYTISNLTEQFVKEWEEDEVSDYAFPPAGPRL